MSTPRIIPSIDPNPCPHCCGEGYLINVCAPGRYDMRQEAWFPSETIEPCPACRGTGLDLREDHEHPSPTTNVVEGAQHDHPPR